MNQTEIREKLYEYITNFIIVPHPAFNNWPPCPYAKKALMDNKVEILFTTFKDVVDTLHDGFELINSNEKEVVAIAFDREEYHESLHQIVVDFNKEYMLKDCVLLGGPDQYTVNGVDMTFKPCCIIWLQKLSDLREASDKLFEKGYYNHWSSADLKNIRDWRK